MMRSMRCFVQWIVLVVVVGSFVISPPAKPLAVFFQKLFLLSSPVLTLTVLITTHEYLRFLLPFVCLFGVALCAGRVYCGWVCPVGTCIDAAGWMRGAVRRYVPEKKTFLRFAKYGVLAVVVFGAFAGTAAGTVLDPVTIMVRFLGAAVKPGLALVFRGHVFRYFAGGGRLWLLCGVVALALVRQRLWCRTLCPLGGLLALCAPAAAARVVFDRTACTHCGVCERLCPTAALDEAAGNVDYRECVVCGRCVAGCPGKALLVRWPGTPAVRQGKDVPAHGGMSRREFLLLCAGTAAAFSTMGFTFSRNSGVRTFPPGVRVPERFNRLCVRCGACVAACPTQCLQPVPLRDDLSFAWTPYVDFTVGPCSFSCANCGKVCPTGAIPDLRLPVKQQEKIAVAAVNKSRCLAWQDITECLQCHYACPVTENAVDVVPAPGGRGPDKPQVNADRCIGCGYCYQVCPVEGKKAIEMHTLNAREKVKR